jgi:hypothetical protein
MPADSSGQVTDLLQHWVRGDERALGDLVPLVYQELRRLAHYQMRSERSDHTLQSTALLNARNPCTNKRWRLRAVSGVSAGLHGSSVISASYFKRGDNGRRPKSFSENLWQYLAR